MNTSGVLIVISVVVGLGLVWWLLINPGKIFDRSAGIIGPLTPRGIAILGFVTLIMFGGYKGTRYLHPAELNQPARSIEECCNDITDALFLNDEEKFWETMPEVVRNYEQNELERTPREFLDGFRNAIAESYPSIGYSIDVLFVDYLSENELADFIEHEYTWYQINVDCFDAVAKCKLQWGENYGSWYFVQIGKRWYWYPIYYEVG